MNYVLPDWMAGKNDFGASLARGVQSGSQMKHNFLTAMEANQRMREADVLMPLKMEMLNRQQQNMALDLSAKLHTQEDYLANKNAFAKLSETGATISRLGAWAKPESKKRLWEIASEHPTLMTTPQFQGMLAQTEAARKAEFEAQKAAHDVQSDAKKLELDEKRIESYDSRTDAMADARANKPARLDEIDRAAMQAEINAITSDPRSMANPEVTQAKVQRVIQKWKSKLYGTHPAEAAPAPGKSGGVPRLKFDPETGRFE